MKINSYFLILIVFLCSVFLFQGKGYCIAGPKSQTQTQTQTQTNITSDSLTVNNKKNIAVFTGHVIAIKGKLKILSSVLNVIYTKKNKIKMLIATGNVHIIKGKDNITGGRAVYYNKKRIAVITENPIAYEGKNKIVGKKIMINFKTGISTVIGGKKRVNAVVYSNKSLTVQKQRNKK
jgi:lipopolysaccharide export system protein LptA